MTGRHFFSLRSYLQMAIRKHNRTIWMLALIILALLITFLFRDGKFDRYLKTSSDTADSDSNLQGSEDLFGDKVDETGKESPQVAESQKRFLMTLEKLGQCFQMSGVPMPETAPVQIESFFQKFQTELGPVSHQADRWMIWHLRTPEGKERALRLEITETDEGKIGRELHYFSISADGQPSAIELEADKSENPSDEVVNQMLKEGEVFRKERAAVSFFPNGERVEFVERDGVLTQMEFFKENRQFVCTDVQNPSNCQCQ